MKKYLDGLKFGMLLQLAVGPMCLMVFNTAKNVGFLVAITLVLAIALVVAVVIGMVIGIQFMTASVEEKAKIKESLLPYAVGCVVVFGAFGIWKLAINVLSNW